MQQRLTIITLGVGDLKKSTRFYEDCFGWHKLDSSTEDIAFFQLNGTILSLYSLEKLAEDAMVTSDGQGFRGFTLAYNAHSEQEVNEIIHDLDKKGVRIVKYPQKVFWGGYSSYIADPDGHLWEIAYNPYQNIDEMGNIVST